MSFTPVAKWKPSEYQLSSDGRTITWSTDHRVKHFGCHRWIDCLSTQSAFPCSKHLSLGLETVYTSRYTSVSFVIDGRCRLLLSLFNMQKQLHRRIVRETAHRGRSLTVCQPIQHNGRAASMDRSSNSLSIDIVVCWPAYSRCLKHCINNIVRQTAHRWISLSVGQPVQYAWRITSMDRSSNSSSIDIVLGRPMDGVVPGVVCCSAYSPCTSSYINLSSVKQPIDDIVDCWPAYSTWWRAASVDRPSNSPSIDIVLGRPMCLFLGPLNMLVETASWNRSRNSPSFDMSSEKWWKH